MATYNLTFEVVGNINAAACKAVAYTDDSSQYCVSQGWDFEVVDDMERLLEALVKEDVSRLVMTHRDRLTGIGAELVFLICESREIQVVILNNTREPALEEAVPVCLGVPKIKPPSRAGRVMISGFFPPEVRRELKMIAVEEGTSLQAVLDEALNMLFASRNLSVRASPQIMHQ